MADNLISFLGDGAEFDKIRSIWRALGDRGRGGGDDCAIVRLGSEQIAISTDLHIEGTHFRPGWMEPAEIGWRAAAAALSDLAAVAADPAGVLVSLGVSAEWPDPLVAEILDGAAEAAASVGAVVWGGDLARAETVTLDIVVVGLVENPVYRSGAETGDSLWVTGRLGGPVCAIEAWESGAEPEETTRERFAHPEPRVREAQWLAARGAKAMIDLSDGLLADAGHLAAASGVSCEIESRAVPAHGVAGTEQALVSGEEFELLVALPAEFDGSQFESEFGIRLSRVGRATAGHGVTLLLDGEPVDVPAGFRHF